MLAVSDAGNSGSAPGQRRLLMPTWARLAQRVELIQQQNREVSEFLTAINSTTAAPVPQQPTRTLTSKLEDSSVLPEWPQTGPLASINPNGWRGLSKSGLEADEATGQLAHGSSAEVMMPQANKQVIVKLEPGRDWSELVW